MSPRSPAIASRIVTYAAILALGEGAVRQAYDEIRHQVDRPIAAYYIDQRHDPARVALVITAHERP